MMGWFKKRRNPLVGAIYQVDDRDRVVALKHEIPQSSIGAPCPIVLSDESTALVVYWMDRIPENWTGKVVSAQAPRATSEPAAVVRFTSCIASFFGPPNDEAFQGHPLADRGLGPYSAVVVEQSSWIRALERLNSVHRSHNSQDYAGYKHFILSFHDTTFECVAVDFHAEVHEDAVGGLMSIMPDGEGWGA